MITYTPDGKPIKDDGYKAAIKATKMPIMDKLALFTLGFTALLVILWILVLTGKL